MLGSAEFNKRAKIYATDIDEDALLQARQAFYSEEELAGVPNELREKYFTSLGGKYAFRPDVRRAVIFGRHDLVQDAPISHLDLLICRNTLMFLNAETQALILARLHFALKPTGYLFLGKAEMLLTHSNLFSQVDLQHRVFTKVNKVTFRDRLLATAEAGDTQSATYLTRYNRLRELSLNAMLVADVTINRAGMLCMANERACSMFNLKVEDIGRPFQDLELSYRPLELRSLIEECYEQGRVVRVNKVARLRGTEQQYLDVQITTLVSNGGGDPIGVAITFEDVTHFHRLHDELRSTHEVLETTNEELQSTNEELETTNEELQSMNEELETTNEELQSTNEELETTNEELQSTNENWRQPTKNCAV